MSGLISGGMGLIGGLFGMSAKPAGPGIAPMMYMLAGDEEQAAYRNEAAMTSRQSAFAYEQSLAEAYQKDYQVRSYRDEQALKFASQGMTLEGSPLGVLEETRQLGAQEVEAIRRQGREASGLYEMQGLQLLRQGSAAKFNGFAKALQSHWNAQVEAYNIKNQQLQGGMAGIGAAASGVASFFESKF